MNLYYISSKDVHDIRVKTQNAYLFLQTSPNQAHIIMSSLDLVERIQTAAIHAFFNPVRDKLLQCKQQQLIITVLALPPEFRIFLPYGIFLQFLKLQFRPDTRDWVILNNIIFEIRNKFPTCNSLLHAYNIDNRKLIYLN